MSFQEKSILKILVLIYHSLHIMDMYMEIDRKEKKKRKLMLWYMRFSVRCLRIYFGLFSIYRKPLYIIPSLFIINSIFSTNKIFVLRLEILNYYVYCYISQPVMHLVTFLDLSSPTTCFVVPHKLNICLNVLFCPTLDQKVLILLISKKL